MGLKKRFNYQWRIFVPLIAGLWVIIFGLAWWQTTREHELRVNMVYDQLQLLGNIVGKRIEKGDDPMPPINFAYNFYNDNTRYDNIRVSVYDSLGNLAWHKSEPFLINNKILSKKTESIITGDDVIPKIPDNREFFFSVTDVQNGRYKIFFLLTHNPELTEGPADMIVSFWLVITLVALSVTVMSYISTRYIARNINILRKFAQSANSDPNFHPSYKFPNDELGDVSRQIMELYNSRLKAMEQREREHKVALHAMEEKTLFKRQITNNINHELKTPIGVIKGYLDSIIETPDMDPATRTHFINKARQNVDRMVALINDVTAISRLEDGKQNIGTEEVNFHDLVYTHANDIVESKLIGNFEFNFNIPLDCKVVGNTSLLHAMLLNLTRNAVAYSGGTQINLICTKVDDEKYTFEFFDNGQGVAPEHLPHLFERFYRVTEGRDRRTGGTGLGLPIVFNTIQFLGGKIEVSNAVPHGLKFTFTLHRSTGAKLKRGPVEK